MTPSETRAVLMDLIEKAQRLAVLGSSAEYPLSDYLQAREIYRLATLPYALIPLLALALKGLDAEDKDASDAFHARTEP